MCSWVARMAEHLRGSGWMLHEERARARQQGPPRSSHGELWGCSGDKERIWLETQQRLKEIWQKWGPE